MILAKRRGKELHARSVLLQGLFFMALNEIPQKIIKLLPYLKRIKEIQSKYNLTVEQLALSYVISQPEIRNNDKKNYMNSLAIIETNSNGYRLDYIAGLISNVLRVNSAVEHQTFGMRIHRMIEKAHPPGEIRKPAPLLKIPPG